MEKKLDKLTLTFNEKKEKWDLQRDKSHEVVKSFTTKEVATKGGVLAKTLGKEGGSVKIQKKDGKIQEERTYPGDRDPRRSKG